MEKPSVLIIAQNEFQGALRTDGAFMRLRGQPISLDSLMREVNKRRAGRGEAQIVSNPNWGV